MKSKSRFWRAVWLYALITVLVAILIIVVLTLLAPTEGAVFSRIVR